MRYGMSEKLGPILFGTGREEVFLGRDFTAESKTYSEKVAATIDEEIKRIIDEQYARAKGILQDKLPQLHTIAEQLMIHEKITGDQFRALLDGASPEDVFVEPSEEMVTLDDVLDYLKDDPAEEGANESESSQDAPEIPEESEESADQSDSEKTPEQPEQE